MHQFLIKMGAKHQRSASDILFCIYEFNECEKFLDCISCEISQRYWGEMNKKLANAHYRENDLKQENTPHQQSSQR